MMKKVKDKIMDEEQYAILRKNGVSEKKATEISENNEYSQEKNIKSYSNEELKNNAKNLGIDNYENMDRNSLISAILECRKNNSNR